MRGDEIIPALVLGTSVYGVKFRPLGGRAQADALSVIAAEGVSLSDDEKALLCEELEMLEVHEGKEA